MPLLEYVPSEQPREMPERGRLCLVSALDSGLQAPVNSLIQTANHCLGSEYVPELQLVAKPLAAEPWTSEWAAQNAGNALGVCAMLLLLRSGARRVGSKIGLVRAEQLSAPALAARSPGLTRLGLESFALGATYEGLLRPVHPDEMHDFWQARLRNGLSGGLTLTALRFAHRGLDPLGRHLIPCGQGAGWAVLRHTSVGGLSGFGAGAVHAGSRSLLADGEINVRDLVNSGCAYAVGGGLMSNLGVQPNFLLSPVEQTTLHTRREREALLALAGRAGLADQLSAQLQLFDARAQSAGLSKQEKARTYVNAAQLLARDSNVGVSLEHRRALALQVLKQAGDPLTIDQGRNNTCNVTTVEGKLYTVSPSDAIRVVAGLALDGKFRLADGPSVRLANDQLVPDAEALATMYSPRADGQRSFASQLFQLGAANSYWQRSTVGPDGSRVSRGSLAYRIERADPADPFSFNREMIVNSSAGTAVPIRIAGELVDQPSLSLHNMLDIERQLTGRLSRDRMVDVRSGTAPAGDDAGYILRPKSREELRATLERLKDDSRFPVTLGMDIFQDSFWNRTAGGAPRVLTSLRSTSYHVLQIVDYDPVSGQVFVDGSWGVARDFTGRPGSAEPLTVGEVWEMMQDGSAKTEALYLANKNDFTEDALRVVPRFQGLKSIDLSGTKSTDAGFRNLATLKQLAELRADRTAVTDAGLATIGSLTGLQRLSLAHTSVTDQGMSRLAGLKNLTELNVAGTAVTAEKVVSLSFANLRLLQLSAQNLTPEKVLRYQAALPSCQIYFSAGGSEQPAWLHTYTHAAKVTAAEISGGGAGTTGLLEQLGGFGDLHQLTIRTDVLSEAAIERLSKLPAVEALYLRCRQVSDEQLRKLGLLPRLRRLSLRELPIDGSCLRSIPQLRELDLSGTRATDATLASLAGLSGLETLSLGGCPVTDRVLAHLRRNRNLSCLGLARTGITDAGAARLASFRKLRELDLSQTAIGDAALAELAKLRNLESLDLTSTKVTSSGLAQLRRQPRLKDLRLGGTTVDDGGAAVLVSIPTLRRLDLEGSRVRDAGVGSLVALSGLEILNLRGLSLTDGCVADLLKLRNLYSLDVSGTGLSPDGLRQLWASRRLKHLVVGRASCPAELERELREKHRDRTLFIVE